VQTSEPGLYGLGCAAFTQRARVVATAVDQCLRPFLLGKDPSQIEDIWQSAASSFLKPLLLSWGRPFWAPHRQRVVADSVKCLLRGRRMPHS
jgi:hypothetical protein